MAIATARQQTFASMSELIQFVQTDTDITTVLQIFQDNNGRYVLVYDTV